MENNEKFGKFKKTETDSTILIKKLMTKMYDLDKRIKDLENNLSILRQEMDFIKLKQ